MRENKLPDTSMNRDRLQQKARQELNELKEEIPSCLERLRKMLEEEELLRCPLDDKFLLRFLRARKFNLSNTKILINHYFDMRRRNVDLFLDLYPGAIAHVLKQEIQAVLPQRDSEGRQVFFFRAGNWNPDTVNLDDIFRSNYIFLEEMTSREETQICGVVAIVDFEGMGFYQARQFTPKHAIRMIQIIQNCFPCRFQEFHLINQPYIFSMLYSVVKPFLSDKIKKRIFFHGSDIQSLQTSLNPSEILPDFLGGSISLPEVMMAFNEHLLQKDQHYKDLFTYGYLPSCKP